MNQRPLMRGFVQALNQSAAVANDDAIRLPVEQRQVEAPDVDPAGPGSGLGVDHGKLPGTGRAVDAILAGGHKPPDLVRPPFFLARLGG